MKLHRHPLSGHCHRVELMLSLLKLDHEVVDIDLASGAHKQDAFLAKNEFGQVPVLEDGDTVLPDSNAILVYLAARYDPSRTWYPTDPVAAASVQRFLSVAAGQIAFGPAAARLVNVFGAKLDHAAAQARANALLTVLDGILATDDYLVGAPTIADVACYSYLAHAPEGDVSLEPFPNVRAWLNRIQEWDGFVPMTSTAAGLVA